MYARTDSAYNDRYYNRKRGKRQYQLKNHLGNVIATVTDRKLPKNPQPDSLADYYKADIITAKDYYPFDMEMPGRSWTADSTDSYRFGFNGKEKDNELKGPGNSYNFGARIYDPRIGRWLSTDPKSKKYPGISPYNFSVNNPIIVNDPDSQEARVIVNKEINTETIQSTIYLYGKKADDMAQNLNKKFDKLFKSRKYKTKGKDGETYTVKFDVNFVHNKTIAEQAKNFDLNPQSPSILDQKKLQENTKFKRGDNLMKTKPKEKGILIQGGTVGHIGSSYHGVADDKGSILHETGHLFGLGERYRREEVNTGLVPIGPNPGFKGDVMSNGKKEKVHSLHYVNFLDYALKDDKNKKIIDDQIDDIDALAQDPASKEKRQSANDRKVQE